MGILIPGKTSGHLRFTQVDYVGSSYTFMEYVFGVEGNSTEGENLVSEKQEPGLSILSEERNFWSVTNISKLPGSSTPGTESRDDLNKGEGTSREG